MELFTTVAEMVAARDRAHRPLGLFPTMGSLHDGHLAVVDQALGDNATVVVSIFVNPAQFGPSEDFDAYPRDLERDLGLLKDRGVHMVFAPPVEEMYPDGYSSYVDVQGIPDRLEGERRPGHFTGVATVVTKLFAILRPDRSYWGQKDGQQVAVVKRLNRDLNLGVDIVVVPTVRDPDGLAMSSRNVYLTDVERRAAPVLYRALSHVRDLWKQGQRDAEALRREVARMIGSEPLASLDYVSVADPDTLEELDVAAVLALVSVAAWFGKTRLIDNVLI